MAVNVETQQIQEMYLIMPGSQFCAPQPDEALEGFVASFQNCIRVLDRIFAYAA